MEALDIYKLKDLQDKGYIKSEKHSKYDLLLWKYTQQCQYEQYWNEYTLKCRSLVTDLEGKIISPCLPKFFNWEEKKHIETEDYEIYIKMDGQLVYAFVFNGELIIRSSGSFVSDVVERATPLLKGQAFWGHITYGFELTGGASKIVVDYPWKERLFFLVAIDSTDGKELEYTFNGVYNVPKLVNTPLQQLKNYNIDNEEGYVIKFSNGDRCKIKFDNYIQKHFFRFALSTTLVWEHLKNNTLDVMLQDVPDESFPVINNYAVQLLLQVESIRRKVEFNVEILKTLGDRKDVFEVSQNMSYASLSLALLDNKYTTDNIYKMIRPEFRLLL